MHMTIQNILQKTASRVKFVKGQLVVRNDMDVHEQRDYQTLQLDTN
jgi:hypothetical protein